LLLILSCNAVFCSWIGCFVNHYWNRNHGAILGHYILAFRITKFSLKYCWSIHFFPLNVVFFSLTWSLCLSCTKGNIFYQTSWGSKAWWRKAWEPKSCDNIHPWWCTSNYWYESGQDIVSWIFAHSVSSTFMYFHLYIF
jgi:hypothetical protein